MHFPLNIIFRNTDDVVDSVGRVVDFVDFVGVGVVRDVVAGAC